MILSFVSVSVFPANSRQNAPVTSRKLVALCGMLKQNSLISGCRLVHAFTTTDLYLRPPFTIERFKNKTELHCPNETRTWSRCSGLLPLELYVHSLLMCKKGHHMTRQILWSHVKYSHQEQVLALDLFKSASSVYRHYSSKKIKIYLWQQVSVPL
jgi:hypothetical protein